MLIFAVVNSGQAVSGNCDLSKHRLIAIAIPGGVTSSDLLVQGSFDPSSASFTRIAAHPLVTLQGSGDLRIPTGPGSKMVLWPDGVRLPMYTRLETGVVLTNPATFTLLVRSL